VPYRAPMSVADAPSSPSAAAPPAAVPVPAPSIPLQPPVWQPPAPRGAAPRRDGLSETTGHTLAVAFAIAWILCPAVEPLPTMDMPYPLWQLPFDVGTVVSIVVAVVALWRGARSSARLGAVAGIFMALETTICPLAGHTPVGWWTWTQVVLSLFVMGTSAALMARSGRTGVRPA
jgi:hypothetical protein